MDTEKQAELVRLYIRADEEANALLVQAIEVYEMAKRIEDLTKDTTDPLRRVTGEGGGEGCVRAGGGSTPGAGGDGQGDEGPEVKGPG